ncbi:Lysophospholipase, alpha-beta hydrolase superfamily [Orenia metallireducens]|uniref:Lysophospholipase, alpha-beta hydrolase superfamily n=1 Tax=Orenia metallireducens TaxID=1413210 RepID=A0A285F403_9FIRM|nr:alpha/beta hydrolase [Orenia metallireducens]SNY05454.1 Lysophospholipase, alpha-beta hydrolase superfamily [Orenia metallireducens]
MERKTFTFRVEDGIDIFLYKWAPESKQKLKGVVQLAHGMAEHSGRYEEFAEFLTNSGYVVYANDHRGHGRTAADLDKLGYFADKEGWSLVVKDIYQLTKMIKSKYPESPLFLLGHSMGSLLARTYIMEYGQQIDGVILSATSGRQGLLGEIGIIIARLEAKLRGKRAKSYLLDKLSFASYNKAFKPNRTDFDWLSRDQREVDKYIQDDFCGVVSTTSFYIDLLTGLKLVNSLENIQKVPKLLPIYIISGTKDPVGADGKGVLEVYHDYKKAGLEDLSYKLYEGSRHELLKEINREEVFKDILTWLKRYS